MNESSNQTIHQPITSSTNQSILINKPITHHRLRYTDVLRDNVVHTT